MFKIKYLLIFTVTASLFAGAQAHGQIGPRKIREKLLKEYGFTRTKYAFKYKGVGPLMGNTENGSTAIETGLGFRRSWFAGYWDKKDSRMFFRGPAFHCADYTANPKDFYQHLNIADGVLHTKASYENGTSYESRMMFSHANKSLLVIELKNTSKENSSIIDIRLNTEGCTVKRDGNQKVTGINSPDFFTRCAWAAHFNMPLEEGKNRVTLKPGETLVMRHTFAVHWEGEDIEKRSDEALELKKDIQKIFSDNETAWQMEWGPTAVIRIPDKEHEKLFYRSIYWMLSTSGSRKFLPGEVQFSTRCWRMHAFTYGGGGWPVFAYTYLGLPGHAKRMLDWHYKPKAFVENAKFYLPGEKDNPNAWSFAHELSVDGYEIAGAGKTPWRSQRHIEGFATAFFHRFNEYYPDKKFEKERLWPVLRGTAEFWSSLSYWDEERKGYMLPKLLSVSENSVENSVLDAVMAAKYCLMMAEQYASENKLEPELAKKWKERNEKMHVPQNKDIYIQFPTLTDEAKKKLAGGYFGYRSPIYLGFPCTELIPYLDEKKVDRTLDDAWIMNNKGHNMITFIASWYALADTFYGRGDHALQAMNRNLECMPEILAENHPDSGHRFNAYYLDSYAAFTIIPLKMLVQSWDDTIRVLPALPSTWKDVEFYNIPAEEGIRVSGSVKDGKFVRADFTKDGRHILCIKEKKNVKIIKKNKKIKLKAE